MDTKKVVIYIVLVSVLAAAEVSNIGTSKRKGYRNVMEDVVKQRAKRESPVSHNIMASMPVALDPTKIKIRPQYKPTVPVMVPANRRISSPIDGRAKVNINANEVPISFKSANKPIPTNAHAVRLALMDQEDSKIHKIKGDFNGKLTINSENDKSEGLNTDEASGILSGPNLEHVRPQNKKVKQQTPTVKHFYEEESEEIKTSDRALNKAINNVSSKKKSPKLGKELKSSEKQSSGVARIVNATHVDITKMPPKPQSDNIEANTESRKQKTRKLATLKDNNLKNTATIDNIEQQETKSPSTINSRKIVEVNIKTNESQSDDDYYNQGAPVCDVFQN